MTDLNYENNRLLDVVDERDQVTESRPRMDVHKFGLLHREVHVWMFDKNNNIIFQKRGLHSVSAGLLDATVGGHVNKGEDYLSAAVREAKEETGIKISSLDLVFLKKFRDSHVSKDYAWGTVNNFIRAVYVYKKPVDDQKIKKESGIPGGGFQKLSRELLMRPTKECADMLHKFVLSEEIPAVLNYLK